MMSLPTTVRDLGNAVLLILPAPANLGQRHFGNSLYKAPPARQDGATIAAHPGAADRRNQLCGLPAMGFVA
jgi:hypothetical protein